MSDCHVEISVLCARANACSFSAPLRSARWRGVYIEKRVREVLDVDGADLSTCMWGPLGESETGGRNGHASRVRSCMDTWSTKVAWERVLCVRDVELTEKAIKYNFYKKE